jgi:hypothetical protein
MCRWQRVRADGTTAPRRPTRRPTPIDIYWANTVAARVPLPLSAERRSAPTFSPAGHPCFGACPGGKAPGYPRRTVRLHVCGGVRRGGGDAGGAGDGERGRDSGILAPVGRHLTTAVLLALTASSLALSTAPAVAPIAHAQATPVPPPPGYYDLAVGKTGPELRAALHDLVDDQPRLSYDKLWAAVTDADQSLTDTLAVLTWFRNGLRPVGNHTHDTGWHRSHLWPTSYEYGENQ